MPNYQKKVSKLRVLSKDQLERILGAQESAKVVTTKRIACINQLVSACNHLMQSQIDCYQGAPIGEPELWSDFMALQSAYNQLVVCWKNDPETRISKKYQIKPIEIAH